MEESKRWKDTAKYRATQKYEKKVYDRLGIRLRKDSDVSRDAIEAAADRAGESLNEYITEAVRQRMDKEK